MAGTDAAAIFRGPTEPMLLDCNMAHLLDTQSTRFRQHLAIQSLHQGVGRTYSEVRDRTRMLVARLIDHGFRPGDRAIFAMGNCVEFVELFFAVASMGGVAVILGPTFSNEETQDAIELVEPNIIFVAQRVGFRSNQDFISGAAESFPGEVVVIPTTSLQLPDACVSFEAFSANATLDASNNELNSISRFWGTSSPSEACCFQFTSGTTGSRKASMLSHKNMINNANLVGHRLKLNAADKVCCCPPLSHCFGLVCGLLASFLHGSTLVLPSEVFDPRACLSILSTENCSIVHGVPSTFEALVHQQKRRQTSSQSSLKLRSGLIAGSTPNRSLLADINDHLGLERLLYPFGMTELSAVCICTSLSDSLLADNSSVGVAMPHTEIKIIDEAGRILKVGNSGELCVSGYLVHLGYYQNEVNPKEAWHIDDAGKRWFRTGDLAVLGSDGKCIIVGRSKDIIKKHGENIAPSEIEEALAAESSVKSVAVVGVPHEKFGEAIVAFVELHSRSALEDRLLKAWLRGQNLSPHKMPDVFLSVGNVPGALPSIPMNTSGKVLRTELRSFAMKLLGDN